MFQTNQPIPKEKLASELEKMVAKELEMPLSVVEKILSFTFKEANRAFKVHNEVELSGFGKFFIVKKRINEHLLAAERREIRLVQLLEEKPNNKTLATRLQNTRKEIVFLKTKSDELL